VAIGGQMLWARRETARARVAAAVAVAVSAGWSWELLDRTPSWEPWLRTLILVAGLAAVAGLLVSALWRPVRARLGVVAVVLGVMASVAGPVAYAAQTISTPHTGSVPSAGPASAGGMGRGFGGGGMRPGASGARGALPNGTRPSGAPNGAMPSGSAPTGTRSGGFGGGTRTGAPTGAMGGGTAGGQTTVSAALKQALKADAGRYRWVAATSGSQSAASLELATGGEPVMAIGGFSGEGGELTLPQFQSYVQAGDIHYYIASAGGGPGGGAGSSSAITSWVKAHYKAVTIGGQTLYDLTSAVS
jgi:hypothetical protein